VDTFFLYWVVCVPYVICFATLLLYLFYVVVIVVQSMVL
jgi:hypothetical protein